MKCSDLMTKDPVCCAPPDSVERVARLMKSRNIGALPVVSGEGSLLGIVTDRDVAVRLGAEGREAQVTPVEAVMSRNAAYCLGDDSVESALALMAARQLRRLPVVDGTSKVVGILSKADIARRLSPQEISELVSRIRARAPNRRQPVVVGALLGLGVGLAGGAALMYLFDPVKGRGRRAVLEDKIGHFCRAAIEKAESARNDIVNRALGSIAERRTRVESRPASDVVLVERVRARLGKIVAHPHAVTVTAEKGVVTLAGCIPRVEIRRLVAVTKAVPGVTEVINCLEHSPHNGAAALLMEDTNAGAVSGD